MAFHWSLIDSKTPQVSRTHLSMAAKNISHQWYNRWPSCSIVFFFQFPSQVFILLFAFFLFYSVFNRDSKVHNFANSFFYLIIIRSGLLGEIRLSVYMSKSHGSLCVSFPKTDAGLGIYHLFLWSNLNFLAHLPVDPITHPEVSSLILLLC